MDDKKTFRQLYLSPWRLDIDKDAPSVICDKKRVSGDEITYINIDGLWRNADTEPEDCNAILCIDAFGFFVVLHRYDDGFHNADLLDEPVEWKAVVRLIGIRKWAAIDEILPEGIRLGNK